MPTLSIVPGTDKQLPIRTHMRIRSKLLLAGLGATLLMALAVATASARNFSITNSISEAPSTTLNSTMAFSS